MNPAPILLTCTFTFACSLLSAEVAQEAYLKASNTDRFPDNPIAEAFSTATDIFGNPVPAPDLGEWFGSAVAVSGETIVVGAPHEHGGAPGVNGDQTDDSQLYAGAAYVFVRIGTSWIQQAYLKASNPLSAANFGLSVAISGDTIVVGAPDEGGGSSGVDGDQTDQSLGRSGAVYVFIRSGTTWTQQAYLKASNPDALDYFGSSVAIDGDHLVVGAPNESSGSTGPGAEQNDNSAEDAGAAYVFVRNGTTWTQQRYLKASNPEGTSSIFVTGDLFGSSVAISGETIVVGAPGEDSGATGVDGDQSDNSQDGSGAAYVFTRILPSVWLQQAYLKASNTQGWNFGGGDGDLFGSAVTISGELVAVSAPEEDSAATGLNGDESDDSAYAAGAVYLFSRSGTTWSQDAYVKASNPTNGDYFGNSLSLSGTTLVVGAPGEDGISTGIDGDDDNNSAWDTGACYVFTKPALKWIQAHYLKSSYNDSGYTESSSSSDTDIFDFFDDLADYFDDDGSDPDPVVFLSYDLFGSAVAVDGTVVVSGAPHEDSNATGINGDQTNSLAPNAGAAYAFDLDAQPPIPQPDISLQYPVGRDLISHSSSAQFGLVVAGQPRPLEFAIVNHGDADLTGITIKMIGTHPADFTPSLANIASIPADGSVSVDVTFSPAGGGLREAILCINSNDLDEAPFTIDLQGVAIGQNSDQDGDGMTDLAEWNLRLMGFDWQKKQTGLVNYYYQTAQAAGLYTTSQVSTLYAPEPLLGPGSSEGKLTLTMDWKISDDLQNFVDLPASPGEVSLTPQGDIKFEFDVPGDRAFFRVLIGE